MTDTLQRLARIRQVTAQLVECRQAIVNEKRRQNLDRLIAELRLNENNLTLDSEPMSFRTQAKAPVSMNQFRTMAEGRNWSIPQVRREAVERTLNPSQAVAQVTDMRRNAQAADVEAWSAQISADLGYKLASMGRRPSNLRAWVESEIWQFNMDRGIVQQVTGRVVERLSRP